MEQITLDEPRQVPNSPVVRRAEAATLRVGLLGLGRVGQAVARPCESSRVQLLGRGVELRITAALVRDAGRRRPCIPSDALVADEAYTFPGGLTCR